MFLKVVEDATLESVLCAGCVFQSVGGGSEQERKIMELLKGSRRDSDAHLEE